MYDPTLFSLTAVINYLAALHGIVLTLIIRRKIHRAYDANTLLSWLLGLSSIILAGATLYNGGGFRLWPHLILVFDPFVLLIPPLIYLYVQRRINGPLPWKIGHLLHLLSMLINLVVLFPFYSLPSDAKAVYFIHHLQHPHPVSLIMAPRILVPVFYIVLSILVLIRHTRTLKKTPHDTHRRNLLWLWHLLIGVLIVWSTITLIHVYVPVQISEEEFSHISSLLSALFIFAMGYRVLLHPEILNRDITPTECPKYQKTGISDSNVEHIWLTLEQFIKSEQPFLEPSLTLKELSEQVSVPQHQLSQVINQKSGDSFYALLNGYRVEHAKQQIAKNSDGKLLSIAFASGFQSLSTFNRVFKGLTGISPSQYRKKPDIS